MKYFAHPIFAILIVTSASVNTFVGGANALSIEVVTIGNPGNAADTRYRDSAHPTGVGSVSYSFRMGKTEISNSQYVEFLNAVAVSDPYELYNTVMGSTTRGGIVRSGAPGSYTYAVKSAAQDGNYSYEDKPVVFVGSGDIMRFANWLHNGQPVGQQDTSTTESGSYTLNGITSNNALAAISRNANARWWLPNEDEWYKAAYHKNDGVTGNYWDYPTGTNIVPNNNLPVSDTGNSANFDGTSGSFDYPGTDVGAYMLSSSPYGTFDQGGNVWEWNETRFEGPSRGLRGGYWSVSSINMHAMDWNFFTSTAFGGANTGFRVAAVIPEPSVAVLTLVTLATCVGSRIRLIFI
jgi:sulfatase modifying factor 1